MREALLVLDAPGQTEDRLIYEMGDGQWDTPSLVTLLDELLPTANSRITKSSTIFSELSFGGINHYAAMGLIFLVVAIIAEVFGFSGAAGEAAWIAHMLFVIAIIFLIVSFVTARRGARLLCERA